MKKLLTNISLGFFLFTSCQSSGQSEAAKNIEKFVKDYDSTFISEKTDSLYLHMIQKIPTDLCKQKQLKKLFIIGYDCDIPGSCNAIGELPDCIGNLVNLETMTYGVTGMTIIPESIKNLKKLRVLCLSDNSALTDISNLNYLQDL